MGWTPLRIAAGVYRAQNFRFDVPTTKAIQELMVAAGVSTKLEAGTTITSALSREVGAAGASVLLSGPNPSRGFGLFFDYESLKS